MNISSTQYRLEPGKNISLQHRGWSSAKVEFDYKRPVLETSETSFIPEGRNKSGSPTMEDGFYPVNLDGHVSLPGFDAEKIERQNPKINAKGLPVFEEVKETVVLPGMQDVFESTMGNGLVGASLGAMIMGAFSFGLQILDGALNLVSMMPRNPSLPSLASSLAIGAIVGGGMGLAAGFLTSSENFGKEFKAEWRPEPIATKVLTGATARTELRKIRIGSAGTMMSERLRFEPQFSETHHGHYEKPVYGEAWHPTVQVKSKT